MLRIHLFRRILQLYKEKEDAIWLIFFTFFEIGGAGFAWLFGNLFLVSYKWRGGIWASLTPSVPITFWTTPRIELAIGCAIAVAPVFSLLMQRDPFN